VVEEDQGNWLIHFLLENGLCNVSGGGGVVMVALCNRADHYIFALWFLSFLPRLILAVGDWMSTILPHMVWP